MRQEGEYYIPLRPHLAAVLGLRTPCLVWYTILNPHRGSLSSLQEPVRRPNLCGQRAWLLADFHHPIAA
jgi:hypothetical protein